MPTSELDADEHEPDEVSRMLAEHLGESAYEIERDADELEIEDPWDAETTERDE